MTDSQSRPRALLLHDGDLADVRAQLDELGVMVCERESPDDAELEAAWDLVVSTPRRVPELKPAAEARRPILVAVAREHARTLRARLRRDGVDFVVRRPFHPAVLRLLLLRALYRGPERRGATRVCVGAPVQVRTGLRRQQAILAELSVEGCRLVTEHPLRPGERLALLLPASLAGGRGLRVRGEVMRASRRGRSAAETELAVAFRGLPARTAARLAAVVASHASGPAALPEAIESPTEADRRGRPRRAFSRRVIALSNEAARVLIGRDLSLGGMRVEPSTQLRVGERVRLALHGGGDECPLVIWARVVRDDGERGFVVRFTRMDPAARRYLEQVLDRLPVLTDLREEADRDEIVVSELLERPPDGASPPRAR